VAALAGRIPSETDPRALFDIAVSITRNICERCGDIIGAVYAAAIVEPALAAVRDVSRRQHLEGITWLRPLGGSGRVRACPHRVTATRRVGRQPGGGWSRAVASWTLCCRTRGWAVRSASTACGHR
jgi:hypothetical protein